MHFAVTSSSTPRSYRWSTRCKCPSRFKVAVVPWLLMGSVVACDRLAEPRLPPLVTIPQPRGTIVSDPGKTWWNTFELDVNVTFSGNAALQPIPNAQSGVGYHARKWFDGASGRWLTDFNHGISRAKADAPGSLDPPRIAGADGVGACREATIRDVNGSVVSVPTSRWPARTSTSSSEYQAAPPPSGRPSTPAAPPCNYYPPGGPPPAYLRQVAPLSAAVAGPLPDPVTSDGREWIDRYIVTPTAAARTRAKLVRAFGEPLSAAGTSRFSRTRGSRALVVLVDDLTGAVREIQLAEQGKLLARTARSYTRQPDGILVLAGEETTLYPAGRTAPGRRIDVTYSNIRITQEAR